MSPAKSTHSLRVLIIDKHEVSRAAIRGLLRTEGLEVIADVSSGAEALASAEAGSPDVVLVDISTEPHMARATALALAGVRSAPTVVLTASVPPVAGPDGFTFIAKGDVCARELRRAMRSENSNR
jgi:DNA-binding NarL/FixJ family response regulator